MDRIMSNEEMTNSRAANDPVTPAVKKKSAKDVKVVSFEIVDDDGGSDPYNRTGSFCVPEFGDDD